MVSVTDVISWGLLVPSFIVASAGFFGLLFVWGTDGD